MAVSKPQLSMVGLKTQAEADAEAADKAARREARGVVRHKLMAALRQAARERSLKECADELDEEDKVYGSGKGVASSTLRSCLEGTPGNYFRLDWILWFLEESKEVADVMLEACGHGKPDKSPEQYAKDLEDTLREELSQRRAEQALRKARAR